MGASQGAAHCDLRELRNTLYFGPALAGIKDIREHSSICVLANTIKTGVCKANCTLTHVRKEP